MKRRDEVYVGHMLDTANAVAERMRSVSRQEYDDDEFLRAGLLHMVQTIGEAARRVSDDYRAAHPEIPWSEIIGMRHKIVHDYIHVNYDIVWTVVTREVPRLVRSLKLLVPED